MKFVDNYQATIQCQCNMPCLTFQYFLGARMSDFKICQKQNHLLRGVCNSDDTAALSTW